MLSGTCTSYPEPRNLEALSTIPTQFPLSIYRMFTSSLRRVLTTVPASPTTATFITSASKAAASQYRLQRRYSSSKPSSPANGAKGVSDTHPAPSQPSRSSRQKSKNVVEDRTVKARDETMQKLPSVPSTDHLKSYG